jgi:hypothetical protein
MDSSKLAAVLKKRQSERAQAKQPVVAPVTQVAVVVPVGPVAPAYPALWQTLQNRKEERKHKPLDREALSEFMEDQKKAVKYQTSKKGHTPGEDDIDWSFTVTTGVPLKSLCF